MVYQYREDYLQAGVPLTVSLACGETTIHIIAFVNIESSACTRLSVAIEK